MMRVLGAFRRLAAGKLSVGALGGGLLVVLAGGVTQAGDALFQPLRAEVRRRAFKPAVQVCRIVPGALPLSAGVVGAIATFKMQKLGEL